MSLGILGTTLLIIGPGRDGWTLSVDEWPKNSNFRSWNVLSIKAAECCCGIINIDHYR